MSEPTRPAFALAIEASSEFGLPLSAIHAACRVRRWAASQSASIWRNFAAAAVWVSGGSVVVDGDAGVCQELTGQVECRTRATHGHRGDQRSGVVEGRHRSGEALLGVDIGRAEQVGGGDPTVLEPDGGRVGGPDAELVLEPLHVHPGCALGNHERLDRRPAEVLVERCPDHHRVAAVAGGHEDLLAVDDVVIAVQPGRRRDAGRVRAGPGLGDGHRRPQPVEPLVLLLVGDRSNG